MKYYQGSHLDMIYCTDGKIVECAKRSNNIFYKSEFTIECFNRAIKNGTFKECDPVIEQKKKLGSDFWHNAVLITILLILAMGFIFV